MSRCLFWEGEERVVVVGSRKKKGLLGGNSLMSGEQSRTTEERSSNEIMMVLLASGAFFGGFIGVFVWVCAVGEWGFFWRLALKSAGNRTSTVAAAALSLRSCWHALSSWLAPPLMRD